MLRCLLLVGSMVIPGFVACIEPLSRLPGPLARRTSQRVLALGLPVGTMAGSVYRKALKVSGACRYRPAASDQECNEANPATCTMPLTLRVAFYLGIDYLSLVQNLTAARAHRVPGYDKAPAFALPTRLRNFPRLPLGSRSAPGTRRASV